ncbi:uncharacterized protein BCR38DRAFT_515811, partial [Pseudomassariella vexata]
MLRSLLPLRKMTEKNMLQTKKKMNRAMMTGSQSDWKELWLMSKDVIASLGQGVRVGARPGWLVVPLSGTVLFVGVVSLSRRTTVVKVVWWKGSLLCLSWRGNSGEHVSENGYSLVILPRRLQSQFARAFCPKKFSIIPHKQSPSNSASVILVVTDVSFT